MKDQVVKKKEIVKKEENKTTGLKSDNWDE